MEFLCGQRSEKQFERAVLLLLEYMAHTVYSIVFTQKRADRIFKTEIRFLAAPVYYTAWRYVPLLSAGALFCAYAAYMDSVYTVTQRSALSLWTSLTDAGVNVILNAVLIPAKFGMFGVALATLISYFVVFLLRAKSARRLIPFQLLIRYLIMSTAVLAVQILFISFKLFLWQYVQAGAIIALLIINRKQVTQFFRIFMQNAVGRR